MRFALQSADSEKQIALLSVGEYYSICWQHRQKRWRKNSLFLPDCGAGTLVFLGPRTWTRTNTNSSPWFLGLCIRTETTTLAFPGFQTADARLWDFVDPIITWATFLFYIFMVPFLYYRLQLFHFGSPHNLATSLAQSKPLKLHGVGAIDWTTVHKDIKS